MRISAVIIAKNEEKIIGQCLDSLRWADEIILVDSGSADETVKIARKYGAKVFKREWDGYSGQKNFGISKARGEWVLSLDADEIVTGELREEIRKIVQSPGSRVQGGKPETGNRKPELSPAGYYIPRKSFFYGKELRFGDIYPDYQLRLFKRGSGKYTKTELHERIELDGRAAKLKKPMLHFSKDSVAGHVDAMDKYTGLEVIRALKIGYRPTGYSVFIKPALNFIKYYFFKLGFLDGIKGLIYQSIVAQYYFVKEVKIMEALGIEWGEIAGSLFKRAR